jgi:hypothetical protein
LVVVVVVHMASIPAKMEVQGLARQLMVQTLKMAVLEHKAIVVAELVMAMMEETAITMLLVMPEVAEAELVQQEQMPMLVELEMVVLEISILSFQL